MGYKEPKFDSAGAKAISRALGATNASMVKGNKSSKGTSKGGKKK